MKKIAVLAVMLIIFNFICTSYFVYADPSEDGEEPEEVAETGASGESNLDMSMDEYKKMADEGIVDIGGTEKKISVGPSAVGSASSRFGTFIASISVGCSQFIARLTGEGQYYRVESAFSAERTKLFTISSLIFGEYLMFYSKAYETSTDLAPGSHPQGVTAVMDSLKTNGISVSKIAERAGMILALPMMLIAVIKVATVNRASDLAAWKKILVRWVLCIALLLFFQYILAAIDVLSDTFMDIFWKTRIGLESDGYQSFEATVMGDLIYQLENTGGVTSLAYALVFLALVVVQMIFFGKYIIRSFAIIFLFIIAPIVMLIHSFNLMLGRNSNMLGQFFKNYISLAFMQPLHVLFYLIFFFSFSEMVIKVPILGIILLYALYRAVDITKAMFGWELGSSIFSFNK